MTDNVKEILEGIAKANEVLMEDTKENTNLETTISEVNEVVSKEDLTSIDEMRHGGLYEENGKTMAEQIFGDAAKDYTISD